MSVFRSGSNSKGSLSGDRSIVHLSHGCSVFVHKFAVVVTKSRLTLTVLVTTIDAQWEGMGM